MAAEVARAAGVDVDVFDAKGSVGRTLLIAGKGGLSLTHSEPMPMFAQRYRERECELAAWRLDFHPELPRSWSRGPCGPSMLGTSGLSLPLSLLYRAGPPACVRRLADSAIG